LEISDSLPGPTTIEAGLQMDTLLDETPYTLRIGNMLRLLIASPATVFLFSLTSRAWGAAEIMTTIKAGIHFLVLFTLPIAWSRTILSTMLMSSLRWFHKEDCSTGRILADTFHWHAQPPFVAKGSVGSGPGSQDGTWCSVISLAGHETSVYHTSVLFALPYSRGAS
jgi:hypothetical protein